MFRFIFGNSRVLFTIHFMLLTSLIGYAVEKQIEIPEKLKSILKQASIVVICRSEVLKNRKGSDESRKTSIVRVLLSGDQRGPALDAITHPDSADFLAIWHLNPTPEIPIDGKFKFGALVTLPLVLGRAQFVEKGKLVEVPIGKIEAFIEDRQRGGAAEGQTEVDPGVRPGLREVINPAIKYRIQAA